MNNQLKKSDRLGGFFPTFLNRYWNDDFFNNFFDNNSNRLPATNIKENKNEFKIELSVPGFNKEDLKIEIDKNILKVSVHKEMKNESKDDEDKVLRQEFGYYSFSRSFVLPDNIDTEHIEAEEKSGILSISIPKLNNVQEDKVRKIEIK